MCWWFFKKELILNLGSNVEVKESAVVEGFSPCKDSQKINRCNMEVTDRVTDRVSSGKYKNLLTYPLVYLPTYLGKESEFLPCQTT